MKSTREQWLERGIAALRPWFKRNGYTVPRNLRATCGFPHVGAAARKNQRVGEIWPAKSSDGKVFEIFISPVLHDSVEVLATLTHELVHGTVGLKEKHNSTFKRCALAVGIEGKMTATEAGEKFEEWAKPALKKLGRYPHKRLRLTPKTDKQTTRLLKCECAECGYTARVTAMWIDNAGAPICPLDEISMEVSEWKPSTHPQRRRTSLASFRATSIATTKGASTSSGAKRRSTCTTTARTYQDGLARNLIDMPRFKNSGALLRSLWVDA